MIVIALFLLGLAFGSFANAVIWRLHQQEKSKDKKLSILKGRSMCPSCNHKLTANDLVPVLSWLELRGKCRYCNKKISIQYPIVELSTVVVFVVSYVFWPLQLDVGGYMQLFVWLVIAELLIILLVYDLKWMVLPNRIVFPLIVISVIYSVILSINTDNYITGVIGALILFGFFYVMFQLSDGRWIGGGDVKLGLALGLIVGGPLNAVLLLFIASLLGSFVSVPLLLKGAGAKTKVPFGPFLIILLLFCLEVQ